MTTLNYGQQNGLRSTLRELASQTEELAALLARHDGQVRIIPVRDVLSESERQHYLGVLKSVRGAIQDMCNSFGIDLDPVILERKLHNSGIYMQTVLQNVRPSNFRGYGSLTSENEALLNFHIGRIIELLNEL
jgi:hypothetical protein